MASTIAGQFPLKGSEVLLLYISKQQYTKAPVITEQIKLTAWTIGSLSYIYNAQPEIIAQ